MSQYHTLPQYTPFPPNGFDRAGDDPTHGGTPTVDGQNIWSGPFGTQLGIPKFFEELPDSPEIERGEQATFTHRFKCDPATAFALLSAYGRGVMLKDSNGVITRVLTSRIQQQKGNYVILTMVSEALSFDNPPDEFDCNVTELNPAIEKHPRYSDLTYFSRQLVRNANISDTLDLKTQYTNTLNVLFGGPSNPTHKNAPATEKCEYNEAKELLFKLHKGITSFYMPGFKITYNQYYWYPQPLNPGGYIEDPIASNSLPYYFWSTNGAPDGPSVFDNAALLNPNIYGNGISWLREADTYSYQRTWFRITSTWRGAPLGHWDHELYTNKTAPYQTVDFNQGQVIL
jgi:hypothetical protein